MIPFNKPPFVGIEKEYVLQAIKQEKIAGDGPFSRLCQNWFEQNIPCKKALLTPSCTHALEMAALLIDIQPGDEVIMPSYTFVSTANAFVLRGAKIIFVDIRSDTMNIDENLIEGAITSKTKAIVAVHYAGVGCEMDVIMHIAEKYKLYVVEDAAQGMSASYKGQSLGSIGHLAAFSFHETKNYTSGGEGGLLIINDDTFSKRAEILREKGTNRSLFFRGMVDKYSWVDIGSSYLPSELQAAYLWGQLQEIENINNHRLKIWNMYHDAFAQLEHIEIAIIPVNSRHNAHMFYIKLKDLASRTDFIERMKKKGVQCAFHYVPLHSSPAGRTHGIFSGHDRFTTKESGRLCRIPLWYGMTDIEVRKVIVGVKESLFEMSYCA